MRIALATVGTTGDVAPFAVLARQLVARGHEVTAVTWPVHRALLAQAGVRVEVAGPHADPARIATVAREAAARGPMDQVAILRDFHLADGETHYRQLIEILPGHDVVLLHSIHSLAHAAAADLALPWASAVFDPVLLPTSTAPPPGMPRLGPANRLAWWMLDTALRRTGRPLDELLSRAGSRQRGLALFRARSRLLHVVAASPAIMEVPSDLPATTRVTGAWLDRSTAGSLPADVEAFLADGAPPIVLTFGSMASGADAVVTEALAAILAAGRRAIVQGSLAAGLDSPSLLHAGGLDHRALFRCASAVVHHGGAGTTHAACAAGVPSVVVPHVGDQRYWAARLLRLGVAAPPLPARELRAERLSEAALATAADPSMHESANDLGGRVAREDGVGTTIAALEALPH